MDNNQVEIAKTIIESGAISIRDVDKGEEPFVYSSGNRGPGYIMIKGLVGRPHVMNFLFEELVNKIYNMTGNCIDVVNGNVTGGVIPGWEICKGLSALQKRDIPYVYLRGSRKRGGHNELITGNLNNPLIKKGANVLIVEELVNYAETTCNAVDVFRNEGHEVRFAACILSYDHESANRKLEEGGVKLISLITLPELLKIAEEQSFLPTAAIQSYKDYLNDPVMWQINRNMVLPLSEGQICRLKNRFQPTKLTFQESLLAGAPNSKAEEGVEYWKVAPKAKMKDGMIFAALDRDDPNDILYGAAALNQIQSANFGFKINLDASLNLDDAVVTPHALLKKIISYGRPVFVDLKMFNGIRTMKEVVKKCIDLEVAIVNVLANIGLESLRELSKLTSGTSTKLFVVTILSHYDEKYCQNIYNASLPEAINKFAKIAKDGGADGIILPPTQLNSVKDIDILKMCPGIRPDWFENKSSNNQVQFATPKAAVENGANYLVCGSPIFYQGNMEENLKKILEEIKGESIP